LSDAPGTCPATLLRCCLMRARRPCLASWLSLHAPDLLPAFWPRFVRWTSTPASPGGPPFDVKVEIPKPADYRSDMLLHTELPVEFREAALAVGGPCRWQWHCRNGPSYCRGPPVMPHTGRLGGGFPLVSAMLLLEFNNRAGLWLFEVVPSTLRS
jgi:hypothetical protein